MRAAFATLALAGFAVANPMPQAVTSAIAPSQSPPAGCYENYQGTFVIGPVNVSSSSKRDVGPSLDERNTQLGITLKNGILTDPQGRIGYIASNQQFQFDGPPQAGAIWTAGFSVCSNGRLALGNDETWWKCLSGSFFNLYFKSQGGQCIESYLIARPINGNGGPIASGGATGTGSAATTPPPLPSNYTSPATGTMTSSSGAMNGTMSGSSSVTMTITGSSTTETTVVGAGQTTITGMGTKTTNGGMTTGGGGQMTTTTGGSGGTATTGGAAASSSSSPAAAPLATLKNEMLGLAAGVLAMAVF